MNLMRPLKSAMSFSFIDGHEFLEDVSLGRASSFITVVYTMAIRIQLSACDRCTLNRWELPPFRVCDRAELN